MYLLKLIVGALTPSLLQHDSGFWYLVGLCFPAQLVEKLPEDLDCATARDIILLQASRLVNRCLLEQCEERSLRTVYLMLR